MNMNANERKALIKNLMDNGTPISDNSRVINNRTPYFTNNQQMVKRPSNSNIHSRNTQIQKRKQAKFIERIVVLAIIIVTIISMILVVNLVRDIAKYPEEYFSTTRNQLKLALNNGDQEAIDRYRELYINRDEYLFNGPVTIKMMAEKYNLDGDELYQIYLNSDYTSAQKFHKDYVEHRMICEEFENN